MLPITPLEVPRILIGRQFVHILNDFLIEINIIFFYSLLIANQLLSFRHHRSEGFLLNKSQLLHH